MSYVVQEFFPRFTDPALAAEHTRNPLRAFSRIDASPSASVRGETCWEGGVALANFLASTTTAGECADKRVLEIGAGCSGYPGRTLALAGAAYVLLTDANEDALEQLRRGTWRVASGDDIVADPTDETLPVDDARHLTTYGLGDQARGVAPRLEVTTLDINAPPPTFGHRVRADVNTFDIILAADVLYNEDEQTCTGLFRTAALCLAPAGRLIIAYAHRADDMFLSPIATGEYGFRAVAIHAVKRDVMAHGWNTELEIVEFARIAH